jgi:hypothetical protein
MSNLLSYWAIYTILPENIIPYNQCLRWPKSIMAINLMYISNLWLSSTILAENILPYSLCLRWPKCLHHCQFSQLQNKDTDRPTVSRSTGDCYVFELVHTLISLSRAVWQNCNAVFIIHYSWHYCHYITVQLNIYSVKYPKKPSRLHTNHFLPVMNSRAFSP